MLYPCSACEKRAAVAGPRRWKCIACGETYPLLAGADTPEVSSDD